MKMRRLSASPLASRISVAWLALWFGAASLVSLVQGEHPGLLSKSLAGPNMAHWMGFDSFGKDLQFSLLNASLRSAAFATICVFIATVLGVGLGASIAMSPRRAQYAALRVLDSLLAFPSLLLALGLAAIRGPGWSTLLFSLLIGILPGFVRLVYARSREILAEPFIEAAQSLGAGPPRIFLRHLVPQLSSICSVKIPLLFAQALMAEATLSFIGVGAPIGHDTWGSLLATGKDYLFEAPHIAFAVGIPLTLTILALQTISAVPRS